MGYEGRLLDEARFYAGSSPIAVDTIYLGGGTPSLLDGERLASLLGALGNIFAITPEAEVTLEANPETVCAEAAHGWRRAGVTRLSIGAQSFDPGILGLLERRASPKDVERAVAAGAEAAFLHLSMDLMMGVPGQTNASLERDLLMASGMPLDHLSVYGLDLHPNARLAVAVERGSAILPSEESSARFYELSHDLLAGAGFEHYEISNFARPGGRSRHNMKYWRCTETIGLGPSAWSRFGGELSGNPASLKTWCQAIRDGRLPRDTVERLTPRRRAEDRLIFGLRLAEGVPWLEVKTLMAAEGRDPGELIRKLEDQGNLILKDGRLSLTPKGFLVSNEILVNLLPALQPPQDS